jgi:hypothetical protein
VYCVFEQLIEIELIELEDFLIAVGVCGGGHCHIDNRVASGIRLGGQKVKKLVQESKQRPSGLVGELNLGY